MCVHGNPDGLTVDIGASNLSQGCSGQLSRVRLEKVVHDVPRVTVTLTGARSVYRDPAAHAGGDRPNLPSGVPG